MSRCAIRRREAMHDYSIIIVTYMSLSKHLGGSVSAARKENLRSSGKYINLDDARLRVANLGHSAGPITLMLTMANDR